MEDDSEAIQNLREIIKERLSPWDLITYDSSVEDFTSHRIGEREMTTSLLRLLESDEYLHQRYTEVAMELQEDDESIRDPTKIEADESAKEDASVTVHGEPNIEADLDIRVKEDVTDERESEKGIFSHSDGSIEESFNPIVKISPSYTLIPEDNRSPVPDTVLNNEFVLVKVDTSEPEKLTGYEKAMAEYEDDMYNTDMLIEFVRNAVEDAEKVMRREMLMEEVGEKFYSCIQQLHRGSTLVKKLRQNYQKALPVILPRLKQKLNDLKVTRKRLHCKRPQEKVKVKRGKCKKD